MDNLSPQQMLEAIPKIERRIAELQAFDENGVNERGNAEVASIKTTIDLLLQNVFGAESIEYQKYNYISTRLSP